MTETWIDARIRQLESDLNNLSHPDVLARWPNRSGDDIRWEIRIRLDELKRYIRKEE